jgi:hypothetical protein
MMTGNPILSDAAMRAQQLEAQYSRKLKDLRQAKEDELAQVDERHKIIKTSYRMERIRIKEDFSLRRLNLKTQIAHLHDQRANLRHALSVDADTTGMGDLEDFTNRIEALHKQVIGLERQMVTALNDAEAAFDNRCKDTAEERRAITKHYINQADELHQQYLAAVEKNRQARQQAEGGAES